MVQLLPSGVQSCRRLQNVCLPAGTAVPINKQIHRNLVHLIFPSVVCVLLRSILNPCLPKKCLKWCRPVLNCALYSHKPVCSCTLAHTPPTPSPCCAMRPLA